MSASCACRRSQRKREADERAIRHYASALQPAAPDHYATLGLDRRSTTAQIRAAYRLLAKRHHPDVNPTVDDAALRTQQLNAAHEVLSDPVQRRAYDRERDSARACAFRSVARIKRNISQDVHTRIEDLLRGTSLDVTVKDPANEDGPESYRMVVPPMTAPGAKFRLPRAAPFAVGFVEIRVRALPGFRFKARGSDLRLDLRISAQRATYGGSETISSASGGSVRLQIPARVRRGEVLRIAGEGLPKVRGGRGDLLVRIMYRPEVRVSRASGR
jgi:curved DNA-binding protein